jgi:hypothetical protein
MQATGLRDPPVLTEADADYFDNPQKTDRDLLGPLVKHMGGEQPQDVAPPAPAPPGPRAPIASVTPKTGSPKMLAKHGEADDIQPLSSTDAMPRPAAPPRPRHGSPTFSGHRGIIKNMDIGESGTRSPMRPAGKGLTVSVQGLYPSDDARSPNASTRNISPSRTSPRQGAEMYNIGLTNQRVSRHGGLLRSSFEMMDGESSEASGYTGMTGATTMTGYTSHDPSSPYYDGTNSEGRAIRKYLQQPLPIRASVVSWYTYHVHLCVCVCVCVCEDTRVPHLDTHVNNVSKKCCLGKFVCVCVCV